MKRIRTRPLPLDFTRPVHSVTFERGKELFAKMRAELNIAARSKTSDAISLQP